MLKSWEKIIDNNFISSELIGEVGNEKVVTIKDIDFAECYDDKSNKKVQKQSLFFEECKPLVLNKTNAKALKKIFSPNEDNPELCIGHKVILRVEQIKAFGQMTNCVRIKEFSEQKCEECGNIILPASGKTIKEIIDISRRNCSNKTLCVKCMKEYKLKTEKALNG